MKKILIGILLGAFTSKRIMVAVLLMILATIAVILVAGGVEIKDVNVGVILLAFLISYLIFSFTIVHVGEVGMMTEWGKPVQNSNKKPTWYFTPLGVVSIRIEKGTIFQDELPAEPEKIYRGDGNTPDGMFPPIRIKFGPPKETTRTNTLVSEPYNVEMVAEVVPVLEWQIVDATTFFTVVGTTTNCKKTLADKAVQAIGDDLAKMTPAEASKDLTTHSQKMKVHLEEATKTWGIKIYDAFVKPIIFSHGLNESVEKVSMAGQGAKATILTAQGEKTKRIEEATGAAEAVRITAGAERERLLKTGLARKIGTGDEIELLPDAQTKTTMDAVGKLAALSGTLVLGGDLKAMLDIKK